MSEFIAELSPFFQWLVKSTTQASVLICVILVVQILLGRKLGLRWYYCLWMLLIVRMLMPWSPQSKADAISDIENRIHTYYVLRDAKRTDIHVVDGPNGKYLRTDPDSTSTNNLDDLPDC